MSNRFHNKFHRANHHSQITFKNSSIIDASLDPIASYSEPFQGEFYTDGEIVTNSVLSANGNIIGNSDLIVSGNVYATTAVLSGDLFVAGNLQIEGNVTQVNTEIYTTSAVDILNAGTGPALSVTQTGNEAIAEFYDDTDIALFIDGRVGTDGNVGIGTNNPSERLTVIGSITSNEIVYDATSNSVRWGGAHTSVVSNSATWTDLRTLSGNWQSTYTTVLTNSADWERNVTDLQTLSGNWQSSYTTVKGASATWATKSELIPTFTNYLSTNNVTVSSLTITDTLSVGNGFAVGPASSLATLFIDGNRVGINTEPPSSELTVTGNTELSGNLYVSGTIALQSTSSPPSNTTTPVVWVDIIAGGVTYKMPLFQ